MGTVDRARQSLRLFSQGADPALIHSIDHSFGRCHPTIPFDLDIPLAVREQLDVKFQTLTADPLDPVTLGSLPPGQGVYELFHQNGLVYAGKANNFPSRLLNHCEKIGGRQHISVTEVGFKCLYLGPNWITFAAEDALIRMCAPQSLCQWNGAGIGPKDPGNRSAHIQVISDHALEPHATRLRPVEHCSLGNLELAEHTPRLPVTGSPVAGCPRGRPAQEPPAKKLVTV